MTILNKKINIWVAIVACLAALGLAAAGIAKAMPSTVAFQYTATATTTVMYLGNGTATSTYQIDDTVFSNGKVANMQAVDSIALFLQGAASSTATTFLVTPQFSNNGIDWYGYNQVIGTPGGTADGRTNLSINNLATTSAAFYWTPGVTATTSTVFALPIVPTQHMRIQFAAVGAAGAVYGEVTMKRLPNNP